MPEPSERHLDAMVEEALVDAYGEDEELTGFHSALSDRLTLPFTTRVLGVDVVVEDLDLRPGSKVVALCRHGAAASDRLAGPAPARPSTRGSRVDRGIPALGP